MKKFFTLLLVLGLASFNALADVNINTATQAQLETLHGIGPGKAKAIIDYRAKNGPFKSLDDLDKVKGIGPGTLKHLKSDIKFSGETVVKAADKGEHKGAAKAAEKKVEPKKAEPAKAEPAKPATPAVPATPPATKAEPAKPATPATPPAKADAKNADKGNKK